jgi:hypothetical protein
MLSACDLLAAPGHGVVGSERDAVVSMVMSWRLEKNAGPPTPTAEHAKVSDNLEPCTSGEATTYIT